MDDTERERLQLNERDPSESDRLLSEGTLFCEPADEEDDDDDEELRLCPCFERD